MASCVNYWTLRKLGCNCCRFLHIFHFFLLCFSLLLKLFSIRMSTYFSATGDRRLKTNIITWDNFDQLSLKLSTFLLSRSCECLHMFCCFEALQVYPRLIHRCENITCYLNSLLQVTFELCLIKAQISMSIFYFEVLLVCLCCFCRVGNCTNLKICCSRLKIWITFLVLPSNTRIDKNDYTGGKSNEIFWNLFRSLKRSNNRFVFDFSTVA